MKKTGFYTILFAALAVFSVSCTQDALEEVTSGKSTEQGERPGEGEILMSFDGNVEEIDASKTSIDQSGNVSWKAGDKVRIYWTATDYAVGQASRDGSSTSFIDVSVGAADYYYAVYPAVDADIDLTSGTISVDVPETQDGSFAKANIMVSRTLKSGKDLAFSYLVSIVKFNIVRSDIKYVTLRSADGSAIAGKVKADYTSVKTLGAQPVFTTTDGSDEIRIAINGAGTYYAAILPGKDIAGGLLFRCETASDYLPAAATKANQTSYRGKIKNYVVDGGMDSKICTDYYATASGSGKKTGKSAADAFDAAGLSSFLASVSDDAEASRSQAFRLYGTTVHCSGTINLPKTRIEFSSGACDKQVKMNVDGGTLSGNNSSNILVVGGNVALTLNNVTLKNGYNETDALTSYGGALRMASSTSKVIATGCTFKDNTAVEGGALAISAGTFEASNTTFSGNNATVAYNYRGGGAVKLCGADAVADFNSCTFSSNTTSGGGGAICVTAGIAGANKCTFNGNSATKYGGCLNLDGSSSKMFLNKCKLYSNTAGGWGTVVNTGDGTTLGINACVFHGNSGSADKDAALVLKSATTLINSTLVENVTANSVVRIEGSELSYLANNIIIAENATKDAVYMNSSSCTSTSFGGNLIGKLSGSDIDKAKCFKKSFSDIYNFKYSDLTNPTWTASSGKFTWDNTSFSGYRPIKTDEVTTALLIGGSEFNDWLSDVDTDALTKDLSGTSRKAAGIRPGSWEGTSMSKSSKKLSIQRMLAYFQWGGQTNGVLVMSHRCHINSSGQTENSVESGKQALAAGADILEIDPRRTSDGNIVVFHDHCIENMINSITQTSNVEELTVSKIQSYDLVERKDFGSSMRWRRSTGIKIPTLAEFFAGVAEARSYYVCLDLDKVISENSSNYLTYIKQIADIVNAAGMMDHALFYVHKAGASAGQDLATSLQGSFASWGYPDACIYTYPYGNSPSSDCNYEWCLNFPQYVYAAQASYSPAKGMSQHNLRYIAEDGMVGTVNYLNTLYSDIPEYSINTTQMNELLAAFPYCNIISTDCPAELLQILSTKGLRPKSYDGTLETTGNTVENYNGNQYNW